VCQHGWMQRDYIARRRYFVELFEHLFSLFIQRRTAGSGSAS
jgi:hypothetical protein